MDLRKLVALVAVFVTLTYPERFPTPAEAKRHLDRFRKRLRRAFGCPCGLWKLEPQQRGAPHFHLVFLLDNAEMAEQMKAWAVREWHDIAGQGDDRHRRFHLGEFGNEHCVQRIATVDQLLKYLGKYIAKPVGVVPGWDWPGRFWGKIEGEKMKTSGLLACVEVEVSEQLAVAVKRTIRRFIEHQPTNRLRIQLSPDTVDRRFVHCKDERACLLGVPGLARPYHRRVRRNHSGITGFISAFNGRRIVECEAARLGVPVPLGTFDGF